METYILWGGRNLSTGSVENYKNDRSLDPKDATEDATEMSLKVCLRFPVTFQIKVTSDTAIHWTVKTLFNSHL